MPEPVGSSQRYMPGLAGLRAIVVLAVIAFHPSLLGVAVGWTPLRWLGVRSYGI